MRTSLRVAARHPADEDRFGFHTRVVPSAPANRSVTDWDLISSSRDLGAFETLAGGVGGV